MSQQRTLIIGDVHGCYHELSALLFEVGANPAYDRIFFIGDLINKGPSSFGVWDIFRSLKATAIMGNHELSMLTIIDGQPHRHAKYIDDLYRDFDGELDAFVADVRRWPLWFEEPGLMLVHAGLEPGKHPRDTEPWHLVSIRTWDGSGADLLNPAHPRWFDLYDTPSLVVFGHWAALGGLNREWVVGLDTGCVYGGMLSCLVLPERRFVRVKAREAYCSINH